MVVAYLLFLWLAATSEATVRLLEPAGLDAAEHESARYAYFGTSFDKDNVTAKAVFTRDNAVCNPQLASQFAGFIVISDFFLMGCSKGRAYETLSDAGALGLVVGVHWSPPGYLSMYHEDWFDKCAMCNRDMPMVSMSMRSGNGAIDPWFQSWRDASMLQIEISAPHNSFFEDAFTSWWMFANLRVIVPLLFFGTAVLAFQEAAQYKAGMDTKESIGYIVNVVEGGCCTCLCIAFLLGQYGDYELPITFHYLFYDFLAGPSLLTTLMVSLLMKESISTRTLAITPKQLCRVYLWRIIAVVLLLPLPLVYLYYEAMATYSPQRSYNNYTGEFFFVWIGGLVLGSVQISCYFFLYAFRSRGLVALYISTRSDSVQNLSQVAISEWRVGYLVFWSSVSGVVVMVNLTLYLIIIVALYTSESTTIGYYIPQLYICVVYSRWGITASHLKAIRLDPSEHATTSSISMMWKRLTEKMYCPMRKKIRIEHLRPHEVELTNINEGSARMTIEETMSPRNLPNWNSGAGHHVQVAPLYN
jgi:hypothetical protein